MEALEMTARNKSPPPVAGDAPCQLWREPITVRVPICGVNVIGPGATLVRAVIDAENVKESSQ